MSYRSARDPSIRGIPSQDSRHRGCDEIGSCAPAPFVKVTKRLVLALLTIGLATRSVAQGQATAGDDRFGVMTHFAQGWDPNWIPLIEGSGIANVRDELYWKEVEPEKGVFRFPARYDRYLGELKKDRISPLIVLSFENPNYDSGLTPYSKEGIDGFARYAVEVLRHCGPQVKAVEVWNEYNGTFNHGPASANRSSAYLEMLRSTYVAIKRERPDVIVVGGATSGIPMPYWEKLMAEGALNYMDVLSVHPYRYLSPPEGIEGEIADLQHLVLKFNKSGRALPIWVTEIGWYIKPSTAPGDLLIDEKVQAEYLVRAYALLLSANVQRVYWYLFRDYENFTMGLMRDDPQRTRKPAYFAYTTLVKQLRDADFVSREATPDDFYSLLFRRRTGQEVRVVWSLTPRELTLPRETIVVDLVGAPVRASGLLELDDSPVFVTGPLHGPTQVLQDRDVILADSMRDFDGVSRNGWSYGFFVGQVTTFRPLTTFRATDWKASWSASYPSLEIAADDQHPSKDGNLPVAAVRRWQSNFDGRIRITGNFHCSVEGDGVGVSILIDGITRFRVLLGGGAPLEKEFDLIETVRRGSKLDFAVDPGPSVDIDFDSTRLRATIHALPSL
jgi:hypothetical protein